MLSYVRGKGWLNINGIVVKCETTGKSFIVERRRPINGETYAVISGHEHYSLDTIEKLVVHMNETKWHMGITKFVEGSVHSEYKDYWVFVAEV